MHSFRKLEVYINGKELVKEVYRLLKQFPREEQYALCDQLRRASISITSNIAEGAGRKSAKERTHFLEIAYGSLTEVISQLDIACDLGYISNEDFEAFDVLADREARLLSGLEKKWSQSPLNLTSPNEVSPNEVSHNKMS